MYPPASMELMVCRLTPTAAASGIDGLPAHAHSGGQFLLGDVFDSPLYFNCILHFPSLLIAFIVKLNFKIYTRKYK